MQRTNSTNWAVDEAITAARLQDLNEDLDRIFERLSNEDLSLTYNVTGYLTQIVDNENSITINIDWSDWEAETVKLYIQIDGDSKKWTITYGTDGLPASIVYA